MKQSFLLLIFALFGVTTGFSQTSLKIGHINTQELLAAMPESDSAQAKIEKVYKDFQSQLEVMQVEFNSKYQEYTAKSKEYSELIRQTKEAELQDLNQRLQQFQQSAETDIQKQRTEIFKPVLEKAKKAITEVGKENGYTYVLDLSPGVILYSAENSNDIMPLVKKKLGLK